MFAENQTKEDLIEIMGIVEHVTFHSEDTGYSVLEVSTDDGDFVTAVGIIPFASEGEGIRALGKWEVHGTYGNQFRVEYYEKRLPDDEDAILRYLSSRAIKGIGPGTAKRIVNAFGRDTFEVMEHNPEFLAQIGGISMKKGAAMPLLFFLTDCSGQVLPSSAAPGSSDSGGICSRRSRNRHRHRR